MCLTVIILSYYGGHPLTLTFSAYKLASLTLKITHRLISEMHGREKVWWLKLNVVFTLLRVLHEGRESRFEPGWLAGICIKSKDPLCGYCRCHPVSYLLPLHTHVRLWKELHLRYPLCLLKPVFDFGTE